MGGQGSGRKKGSFVQQETVAPVLPEMPPNTRRKRSGGRNANGTSTASLTPENPPSPSSPSRLNITTEITEEAIRANEENLAALQARSAERAAYWEAEIAKNITERRYDYEWMTTFLATLRNSGNVRASCEKAGISRQSVYVARDRDSTFRDAWEEAQNDAVDILEAVAWKRAQTQSDTMLIFLLKHNRPEKYLPPKNVEHSGPGGGAIPLSLIDSVIAEHLDTLDVIDGQYEDIPQLPPGNAENTEGSE